MHLLIYASSAAELFSQDELEQLLEKARRNNHALGVTGMLLYKDGNFMQLLEGPKEAVIGLIRKIELDDRHRGIIRLLEREQPQREFADWSMGFKRLESASGARLPGHSDFLERPLNDERFRQDPSLALQLLLTFKKVVK